MELADADLKQCTVKKQNNWNTVRQEAKRQRNGPPPRPLSELTLTANVLRSAGTSPTRTMGNDGRVEDTDTQKHNRCGNSLSVNFTTLVYIQCSGCRAQLNTNQEKEKEAGSPRVRPTRPPSVRTHQKGNVPWTKKVLLQWGVLQIIESDNYRQLTDDVSTQESPQGRKKETCCRVDCGGCRGADESVARERGGRGGRFHLRILLLWSLLLALNQ